MRADRDTILICLALAPVGFMIFVIYQWQSSGMFPLGLFSWAAPNVPFPAIPAIVLPAAVVALWQEMAANDISIGLSLGIGLLAGIVVIGSLTDSVSLLSRLIHRHGRTVSTEPTELEFPEPQRVEPYIVR